MEPPEKKEGRQLRRPGTNNGTSLPRRAGSVNSSHSSLRDSNGAERAICATLLAEYSEPLPPNTKKLLRFAPESFTDPKLGAVAQAIFEVSFAGDPVCATTVRRFLEASNGLTKAGGALELARLEADAVTIDLAEFEAVGVWEAYQANRSKSVLAEGAEAVSANPNRAALIINTVTRTLAALTGEDEAARTLTVRSPDEILGFNFDDSDRILGDRLLATGQYLTICGAGETGKSRLLLQLAVCTITGRPFLGFETRGTEKRWLILQAENSNRRLQHDLSNLREWTGAAAWQAVNRKLKIHTLETDEDGFLNLDEQETVRLLDAVIEEHQPDIIG